MDKDSLSTRRAQLQAYCQGQAIRDAVLYEEANQSAKDANRPTLRRLLQDVRAGKVGAVIFTRLDRITRSIIDLWDLVRQFREHDVSFTSLAERIDTEGPAGRFLLNILGSLAQFEREIIAARVAEAMHHRAAQGKWNGGPVPYGYTTQARLHADLLRRGTPADEASRLASKAAPEPKRLYVDTAEARTVKRICRIYLETRSIRQTAAKLNEAGLRTRTGAFWSTTTVARILASDTYAGMVSYGRRKTDLDTGHLTKAPKEDWQTANGLHEAIIPLETVHAVREALRETSQKPKTRVRAYPLSGLLRCGKCGRPMHGFTYTKPNGSAYSYYKCPSRRPYEGIGPCDGFTVRAERLEDFVAKTLTDMSRDRAFLADREKMLAELRRQAEEAGTGRDGELARLRKQEQDLAGRREALLDALERRAIDDSIFGERYRKLTEQLEDCHVAQARHKGKAADIQALAECLEVSFEEIASFEKNWALLDPEGRASLLQTIVKQILVTKEDVKLWVYLDPPLAPVVASSRTDARAATSPTPSASAPARRRRSSDTCRG